MTVTLLDTRRWVLERAGFEVRTVSALSTSMAALTAQTHQLLVLCHSLSANERLAACRTATNLEPPVRTLSITTLNQQIGDDPIDGDVFDSLEGAPGLIAAVRRSLR